MTIDRETLMAYADGELDELTRRRVEQAIADDPALAAQVEADRALRARISGHYAGVADQPVPDRLRALLDSNVHEITDARPMRQPVRRWVMNAAAIAATLIIGVFVGREMGDAGPFRTTGDMLVAQGALARALDTQLASSQSASAATRIGVSFRGVDGGYCRTFSSGKLDGLACRTEQGWILRNMANGEGQAIPEYRQAGSMNPALLAAAQAMMVGDPLDAAAEQAARDGHWR
ncbi:anti-sigma factor family protein [Sphingomonas colocasiae]|uniref:Anti-sigma factor n=1 Tax=Sphingomonas colocasiae TaxID=1848973 RepID=A0ABS7PHZ5_9SPHN|nr:anti-sigma factor [Sphingomonas colocasiae]MBY8820914.1 anti-sigma factor [Sphingomonas colocasiae]